MFCSCGNGPRPDNADVDLEADIHAIVDDDAGEIDLDDIDPSDIVEARLRARFAGGLRFDDDDDEGGEDDVAVG